MFKVPGGPSNCLLPIWEDLLSVSLLIFFPISSDTLSLINNNNGKETVSIRQESLGLIKLIGSLILPFSGHSREHASCWEQARNGEPKGREREGKKNRNKGRSALNLLKGLKKGGGGGSVSSFLSSEKQTRGRHYDTMEKVEKEIAILF